MKETISTLNPPTTLEPPLHEGESFNASLNPKGVDFRTICIHEAGHAVMRHLVYLPATELVATPQGGYCAGSGTAIDALQEVYVSLAGLAAEVAFWSSFVDFENTKMADVDDVRRRLNSAQMLRFSLKGESLKFESIEDSLKRHFEDVCNMLWPFSDQIDHLGELLERAGKISARSIAAFMRANCKKMRDEFALTEPLLIQFRKFKYVKD